MILGNSVFSLRKSASPENSHSSLPSRLNEVQSSSSSRPPHTIPSLPPHKKTVSPAVNVITSPNVPYDIAQDHQLLSSHSSPYAPVQHDTTMYLPSSNPHISSSHAHMHGLQYPGQPQGSPGAFTSPPMVHQMSPQPPHMYYQAQLRPEEHLLRPVQTDQYRPLTQARPPIVQGLSYHHHHHHHGGIHHHGNPMMSHVRPEMVETRPQFVNQPLEQTQYQSLPHNPGNYPAHPVPLASQPETPRPSTVTTINEKPQLTGYTEVSHPIASYNGSPVPVSAHQGQYVGPGGLSVTQETDPDDKSTSSFYSAEDGPASLPRTPKVSFYNNCNELSNLYFIGSMGSSYSKVYAAAGEEIN